MSAEARPDLQDSQSPPLTPDGSSSRQRQQQRRHQHQHRRGSNHGRGHEAEDAESSQSESGSTSCSTASVYSVGQPGSRGRRHRHRHHRRSYGAGEGSRPRSRSRMQAEHNASASRRSSGKRRQVVIDDGQRSAPESDSGSGSESGRSDEGESGGRGRRRSMTNESSSEIIEDDESEPNVRARQEALNTRHPFGLPIWKPALYKKSRSVTRAAFLALHARPLRSTKLYLKPGNIAWMLLAGWWLLVVCMCISALLFVVPYGGREYARVAAGLGWYLLWPFGRYVERIKDDAHDLERCSLSAADVTDGASAMEAGAGASHGAAGNDDDEEGAPLLGSHVHAPAPASAVGACAAVRHARFKKHTVLGRAVFYTLLVVVLNPILIAVSAFSWFAVFSIPMGKLTHTLARYLWRDPLSLHFRSGDLPT
ncbi:hypothetical protein LPJ57_005404, partial [Coemansia sp. RSA 486]